MINYNFQNKRSWLTTVIFVLVIGILLSSCGAEKPKVYRVGVLSGLNFVAAITDGFKEKMTELGYIEGQNIVYDVQKTDFDLVDRCPFITVSFDCCKFLSECSWSIRLS